MALAVEQPLVEAVVSDEELPDLETASDVESQPKTLPPRKKLFGLLPGTAALLALAGTAVATSGRAAAPQQQFGGNSIVSLASGKIAAMAELREMAAVEAQQRESHVRYSYGLHEAPCPDDTDDRSEGARVTLPEIKKMIGADTDAEVRFWWVYPHGKSTESEADGWEAATQFKYHGGYMYTWGTDDKYCLALTPKGHELFLKPASSFPEVEVTWHEPAGEGSDRRFAWIPPIEEGKSCHHGCFVYKSPGGDTSALEVIQDAEVKVDVENAEE